MTEMSKYLRQTVDNSLEEGQFEIAVTLLTQLCSPHHIPSAIHVLHLVFIALHPSTSPCRLDDADPTLDRAALLLQSPRKIIKQAKSALVLEPPAVVAAQSLLHALLRTNGPAALTRALPAYPEPGTKNPNPAAELEFVDSPIFHQAAALKNARSVWDIVKGGYATKSMQMFGTPKGRGKQPRSSAVPARDASFSANSHEQDEIKVVGDDSWFVLDWLVAVFEYDSDATYKSGQPKHSPLLLKQLPPPPTGSSTRWDASEPLKIVFYAFKQPDPRRQRTGLRLLSLLIDLTHTTPAAKLNLPSFAATVLSQLATSCSGSSEVGSTNPSPSSAPVTPPPRSANPTSSVSWTPQDALTTLFTHVPSTPAALAFKITLCKKILAELDSSGNINPDASFSDLAGKPISRAASGFVPNSNPQVGATTPSASGQAQPQNNIPRPRPIPKARPLAAASKLQRTDTVADVGTGSGGPPSTISPSVSMASVSHSGSTTNPPDSAGPPVPTPAPAPAPTPLPPLPPLAEISRLLHLRPSSPSYSPAAASPSPTRAAHTKQRRSRTSGSRSASASASATRAVTPTHTHTHAQSPWTTPPALLLRVKFELLLAWVTLRRAKRGASASASTASSASASAATSSSVNGTGNGNGISKGGDGAERDKNDVSDAELAGVIDAAFGESGSGSQSGSQSQDAVEDEEEAEGYVKQKRFYRDALRAFGGLPIGVKQGGAATSASASMSMGSA